MPISKAEEARRRHLIRNRDAWKRDEPARSPAQVIAPLPDGISIAEAARRRHIERNKSGKRHDAASAPEAPEDDPMTAAELEALREALLAAIPDEEADPREDGAAVKAVYRADRQCQDCGNACGHDGGPGCKRHLHRTDAETGSKGASPALERIHGLWAVEVPR